MIDASVKYNRTVEEVEELLNLLLIAQARMDKLEQMERKKKTLGIHSKVDQQNKLKNQYEKCGLSKYEFTNTEENANPNVIAKTTNNLKKSKVFSEFNTGFSKISLLEQIKENESEIIDLGK